MTIFFDKARGQWSYDFQRAGIRYRGRCFTETGKKVTSRRQALMIEAEARTRAKVAGKYPRAGDLTLIQVLSALSEGWQNQRNWDSKKLQVREILEYFGPETPMRNIDGAKVQDYITQSVNQTRRVWHGGPQKCSADTPQTLWSPATGGKKRKAATVNRSLCILRAAFKRAFETCDPITGRRAIDFVPTVTDLPEDRHKANPVPDAAIRRLGEILPPHITEAMRATLYFGFRRDECFGLKIHQVDFEARGVRLEASDVKNHTDAFLPGGPEAMDFLRMLVDRAHARGTNHLFTWRRSENEDWRPIASPRRAWATAMDKIEEEFGRRWRWHDLRAAYITYVALTSGAVAAQKLARHSSFTTTQGYIEVADEITRKAAERAAARPALIQVSGRGKH